MVYYIEGIKPSNWITWRCGIWDSEEEIESDAFLELYKEYANKEFPTIKTKGKHISYRRVSYSTIKSLKELKTLRLHKKDKRVDGVLYIIDSFIGDIECNHYVFNVIEEGD